MRKLLLALCCFSALGIFAQQADYQKACAKYKKVQSVTAKCQRVRHRTVVAQDEVLYGTFQMVSPDKVNITMDGGKEALDMQGTAFTMTMKGKAHKTSSKTNPQFKTFQAVWESILSGGTDLSKINELEMKKEGADIVISITPKVEGKAAKRMMFSSFVLIINGKNGEVKSLCMNEKGQNYTLYTFSDYQWK